ncbi:pirin family protein [Actimicrobium antarcticum]|uniref:Pirin family protein n=1 Tax=Actimicrobium antarcticum TaxID=1051899 RepID=A0ABP7U0B2_9BURK
MSITAQKTTRGVARITQAQRVIEGAGFEVQRAVPAAGLEAVGPFIFVDHFGPVDYAPGKAMGAPDHPHAGIETLTYFFEGGGMRHRDSLGNVSTLQAGGAQWMRAGRGIVHDESPDEALLRDGGRVHGAQLWINLPSDHKMDAPQYQAYDADQIPHWTEQDGKVQLRLIAGQLGERTGPVASFGNPWLLHLTLQADARCVVPLDGVAQAAVYVVAGSGCCGIDRTEGAPGQLIQLEGQGSALIEAGAAGLDVLVLGGDPLDAPIVRHGPFVMNTHRQLQQAVQDFQQGKMGRIEHGTAV